MKKAMLGALLAVAAMATQAGPFKNLESSAIVSGSIVLAKDGTVQAVTVDNEARYGKPIADLVRKAALQWLFYPVVRDGKPVVAKSNMYVRVVLSKTADGNYSARIKGATFGSMNSKSTEAVHNADINKNLPPRYPMEAIRARVQGTVYLALRVDRSGKVVDAVAEQVNLQNSGPDNVLNRFRRIMAEASLQVAHRWQYVVPTTGPLAQQASWTVHVPINFQLGASSTSGAWETYVPGPYTPAPWTDKSDMATADILSAGGLRTDGAGPVLRSP